MPLPSMPVPSRPSRLKGWNSERSCSGVRPAPVSWIAMRIRPSSPALHSTITAPCSRLYFTAFESRFSSTCFRRVRSALTLSGVSIGNSKRMPRCADAVRVSAWHSSSTSCSSTGSRLIDSLPDSICARFRTSLISVSKWLPASTMCLTKPRLRSGNSLSTPSWPSSWPKPMMALSGVRSSWLMLDRNSDLARLALSASRVAASSSRFDSSSCAVRTCTRRSSSSLRRITSCCVSRRSVTSRSLSAAAASCSDLRRSISASRPLNASTSSPTSSSPSLVARRESTPWRIASRAMSVMAASGRVTIACSQDDTAHVAASASRISASASRP